MMTRKLFNTKTIVAAQMKKHTKITVFCVNRISCCSINYSTKNKTGVI